MAVSLLEVRRQILLNTPHIESVSGSIATFNTDLSANLTDMKIHFHPVQEGTGDPSPDNVRPITGWDGVIVTRCGKNLAQKMYGYNTQGGNAKTTAIVVAGGNNNVSSLIHVKPGLKYALSLSGATSNGRYFWFKENPMDGTAISIGGQYAISNIIATAPEDANYLFVLWTRAEQTNTCGDVQIELGSEVTPYEPYQPPLEIPISFPQTIYGGYVDLVKGEVVETQYKVLVDGENVKCNSAYITDNFYGGGWVYADPHGQSYYQNYNRSLYLCDKFVYGTASSVNPCYSYPNAGYLYYVFRVLAKADYSDELTNKQVIDLNNEWLQENPVTVVYPLIVPNTYPLTPQTLKALKGINNIWSDANGDVEVRFWVH